ncbi:MAG: IS1595 family transposase [Pseudomonadota bacterium]|nr:IS1595 family transposase [Pseudomonadota bacterium]
MFDLTNPIYQDPNKAREYLEGIHWPNGPVCPHCGGSEKIRKLKGKSTRPGVYKCNACRKPFTVTVGTIFEDSKIPLNKWLLAFRLMAGSKKGISAHQLHRSLGITYKSAWFMAHRVREAMRSGDLAPFGSGGGAVEIDETFIGRKKGKPTKGAYHHKMAVLGLVDRDTGRSRLFHVEKAAGSLIQPIVLENLSREARLMTDESTIYRRIGRQFAEHGTVLHYNKEYVRGDITTNTVEGCFSIFKRGMRGVYQHCAEKHLHRYLAEFEFRYSFRQANGMDDRARTDTALLGAIGRRLTYRRTPIVA